MFVNEIVTESKQLDEVSPTSAAAMASTRKGQKPGLWNKTKALGSKMGTAAGAALGFQGAQDTQAVGQRANELYKNFKTYAARSGIPLDKVPKQEMQNWMKSHKVPVPDMNAFPGNVLKLTDPNTSKKFWTAAANVAFKKGMAVPDEPLGVSYGTAGRGAAPAAGGAGRGAAPAAGGAGRGAAPAPITDYNTLRASLAKLKSTLTPRQINDLKRILG